jgi:cardiolipin synthase A/B
MTPERRPSPRGPSVVSVGSNLVRLLRDGPVAFPIMLDAIAHAKSEIVLEMYWVGPDRVGQSFRDALAERARAGVRVSVLYDSVGSLETPETFWTPLLEAGGEVEEYAPISPWKRRFRLGGIVERDHRKLLVVDGEVAYLGGINLGDLWSPEGAPERAWRDDDVEIRGPAAKALRSVFYQVWRRTGRRAPRGAPGMARVDADPRIRVLTNRIDKRHPKHAIRRAYLYAIRHATTSIDIANAYFLPGPLFLHALRKAARRGVRVRLLVPEHSDVVVVSLAMSSLYGRLLSDGADVFVYSPRVMHSKTAIFDQRFTMIGSHNLDTASYRYNLECNVLIDSVELAKQARASFERDLEESKRLALAEWRERPGWLRFLGWFAASFERIL